MCGGDVWAVIAAILGSDAPLENLLFDFSDNNIIHPKMCRKFHNLGSNTHHSEALQWARMKRRQHLRIKMHHCYCDGVDGFWDCAPWMPKALYCNFLRGLCLCSLQTLHLNFSKGWLGTSGQTIQDDYLAGAITNLIGVPLHNCTIRL